MFWIDPSRIPPAPPRPKSDEELRAQKELEVKATALSQTVLVFKYWALNRQNLAMKNMAGATGEELMIQTANFHALFETWKAIDLFERDFGTDHDC